MTSRKQVIDEFGIGDTTLISIYDRACALMADKDVANGAIKDNELAYIVANFDDDDVEALLMDIIHLDERINKIEYRNYDGTHWKVKEEESE